LAYSAADNTVFAAPEVTANAPDEREIHHGRDIDKK
jgi:hypothetical protein